MVMRPHWKQQNWNSAMSKRSLLYCCIAFVVTLPSYTQEFELWGNPYIGIYSYNGITTNGYYTLAIKEQWGTQLYAENWRVTVRLTGNIVSKDGTKVFPSDKVGLILTSTEGQPVINIPGVNQINVPYPVMLLGSQERDLVNGANVALSNKVGNNFVYYQFQMNFQLAAIGGGYLDILDDDNGNKTITYSAPFEFKAYIGGNVFTIHRTYDILQVHKLSTNANNYSILVDPATVNMEFNTAADYVNGKNITYPNGITVKSNVAYQLRVSSIYPNLSSTSGNILPLDLVRIQLSDNTQSISSMPLSGAMVPMLNGAATGSGEKKYNLTFTTVPNDSRIFNIPTEQYSTSLLFEITPQ